MSARPFRATRTAGAASLLPFLPLLPVVVLGVTALPGCAGSGADDGDGSAKRPLTLRLDPVSVGPGEEVTVCQVIHAGNEALDFKRVTSTMVEGSHHLILYRDASNLVGNAPPPAGLGECEMPQEHPRLYVYSAQEPQNEVTFPAGIGGDLEANTVFILEVHYANASTETVEAFAEVKIYPAEEGEIEQYSGILFYMNRDFSIPPGAGVDGAEPYTEGVVCEVPENVNVFRTSSHTHKRGIRVDGWLADEQGAELQKIYKNEDWHAPVQRTFEPALPIIAGQTVKFDCTWTNETGSAIGFGPSVEDEMCILGLGYYPRVEGPLGLRGNVFCLDGQILY